jgi:hypothetical protein
VSYVIYNTETLQRMKSPSSGQQTFETERVAKTIRTKVLKKVDASESEAAEWVVAEYSAWQTADVMITVKSLMNGADVQIRKSQRGSRASDPSMEGYWTM